MCNVEENLLFSTLILGSVFNDYVVLDYGWQTIHKIFSDYLWGLLTVTASHVHCKRGNISETVPGRIIATTADNRKWCMWPIEYSQFLWPWVTLKVITYFEPFKCNVCTAVQRLTRFQLTWRVAQCLWDSGASCVNPYWLFCEHFVHHSQVTCTIVTDMLHVQMSSFTK